MIPPKTERNLEILRRYQSGERVVDLAMHYGISVRRVNRLIRKVEGKELY
jgi:Mor family transcriptional regulator